MRTEVEMEPYKAKNMQELITAIKETRGWKSTRDAAQGMGISHTMVAKFENGETTQDRDVLIALAKASRLRLRKVLEITGYIEPEAALPPDIEAITDLLLQHQKSNPKLSQAVMLLIRAQLYSALDLPDNFLEQENN